MELFRLLGTIAIDNAKAMAGLDETSTKAKSTSEKMSSAFQTIGQKSIDLGKKMALVSTAATGILGSMVKSAASVKAVNAQFEQTFDGVEKKASSAMNKVADSSGILETRLKGVGTKMYAFAKTTGMETPQALSMMERALTVTADSAAYYDRSLEETAESLQSFLKGNFENDAALGLSCTETTRNAAANKLYGKSFMELSEAQKQLTLLQMVEDANKLSGAMGQAARESDGWENVIGNLKESVAQLGASIGEEILPTVTKFIQKATKFVSRLSDMDDGVKKVIIGFLTLTAAASPALIVFGRFSKTTGKLITSTQKSIKAFNTARVAVKNYQLATNGASIAAGVANGQLTKQQAVVGKLSSAAGKLWGVLKAHPFAIIAGAAAGMAIAIYKAVESLHAESNAAEKAAQSREKLISSAQAQNRETDIYFQKLKDLEGVENKTATQKQLMQTYVDKLNDSVDGLNLSYDAEKDKLNQSTDAIHKKIEAQEKEAITAAYLKVQKKALEDYAKVQLKIADKETELAQKKERLNELTEKGTNISQYEAEEKGRLSGEIKTLNREMDDLTDAQMKYNQEAVKATNQANMQSGAWDKLLQSAGTTAKRLPQTLIEGINTGKYAIPTTVEELNALIKFDKAVQNAKGDGKKLADNLSAQIANGSMSVSEATKELTAANKKQLEKGADSAKTSGANTGKKYAQGTESKKTDAKNAGKALGDSAKAGAGSVSLYQTGKNIGSGLASGLRSAIEDVRRAANQIAEIADKAIKKKQQINSPSKLQEWNALMMGKGLGNGLIKSIPYVQAASEKLADAASITVPDARLNEYNTGAMHKSVVTAEVARPSQNSNTADILRAILSAIEQMDLGMYQKIEEALDNRKIQWNDRELGRFVKNYA